MDMEHELSFYRQLLSGFSIQSERINLDTICEDVQGKPDEELMRPIAEKLVSWKEDNFQPNTIYYLTDFLYEHFILFPISEENPQEMLLAGPYTTVPVTHEMVLELVDSCALDPTSVPVIEKLFKLIPCIEEESFLLVATNTLALTGWGRNRLRTERFSFNRNDYSEELHTIGLDNIARAFDNKIVENHYEEENAIIKLVTQGQISKMDDFLSTIGPRMPVEPRVPDPLRNQKNYLIILNTLLRKAAEQGGIHPIYIDEISRNFAYRIEALQSLEESPVLQRYMMRRYCLLVHNHSMKGYSPLIQKVIIHIDSDLTADLSLSTLADQLNINASYLSALFHKETGTKLTPFVNSRRIEHAIMLLNTTTLQVQAVAQYSGFTDINYFTRIFKKEVGMTPSQYRKSITDAR